MEMGLRNWEIVQLMDVCKKRVSSIRTGTNWSELTGIKRGGKA
jgi:hypothetical protein